MLRKPASRLAFSLASLVLVASAAWRGADSLASPSSNSGSVPAPAQTAIAVSGDGARVRKAASEAKSAEAGPSAGAAGFVYTAPVAQPIAAVVHRFWPSTQYMTRAELEAALRQANHLARAGSVKAGQRLVIPGYEEHIVERPIPVAPEFEVRAIYLTGIMAGSQTGLNLVRRWRQMGGNTIVFDIKDSDGAVNVPFDHPLAPRHSPAIPNLPKYVRYLHSLGMHAIARIALFRDETLVQHHPELAVRSRRSMGSGSPARPGWARGGESGKPWLENGKLVWTDSSNSAVQEYNLALARQVAASGVDEVQFDYVRFPAEGDQKDAQFAFESEHPKWERKDVITHFVARAYALLHPTGVLVSLDVFGVTAWQDPADLAQTGQDVVAMARHCDVLSPMIYPSHFFGMEGYASPGDAPEHFISESMDKFEKILATPPAAGTQPDAGAPRTIVVLRPWLQAFAWRTKTYGVDYILTQVQVAKEHGGVGFLFWNASNDYSKPLTAMEQMRAAPGRYFRGDELPGTPLQRPPADDGAAASSAR